MWVSVPLTVHRRRDPPMFDLCNRIAYGGIMISEVGPRGSQNDLFDIPAGSRVPCSQWVDVSADRWGSYVQPEQVRRLRAFIDKRGRLNVSPSRISWYPRSGRWRMS